MFRIEKYPPYLYLGIMLIQVKYKLCLKLHSKLFSLFNVNYLVTKPNTIIPHLFFILLRDVLVTDE